MVGILITLFILSVLVLIHEFGHFITAKLFNIKVEEFGYGLPPFAWGKKIGETLYSINWLPIGGFVKLYGEDEAGGGKVDLRSPEEKVHKKDMDRAFFARPVWQRAVVVVAGVVMNTLLAFVIYYAFMALAGYKVSLPLLSDHKFFGSQQVNFNVDGKNEAITYVAKDSPAEKAGIEAPARIISVNDAPVTSTEEVIKIINVNKGKEVKLGWEEVTTKDGNIIATESRTGTIIPRANPPENEGPTGIAFLPVAFLNYEDPAQKVLSGITHPINLMSYNFSVMAQLISVSIAEKNVEPVSQGLSGPVGVFSLGGAINDIPNVKERVMQFLNLAGLLSISLAFFNVLPIPALDGGRLFFILIEGITGRKVNQRFETLAHTVGMAVLLGLILLVTFKDILQLLK